MGKRRRGNGGEGRGRGKRTCYGDRGLQVIGQVVKVVRRRRKEVLEARKEDHGEWRQEMDRLVREVSSREMNGRLRRGKELASALRSAGQLDKKLDVVSGHGLLPLLTALDESYWLCLFEQVFLCQQRRHRDDAGNMMVPTPDQYFGGFCLDEGEQPGRTKTTKWSNEEAFEVYLEAKRREAKFLFLHHHPQLLGDLFAREGNPEQSSSQEQENKQPLPSTLVCLPPKLLLYLDVVRDWAARYFSFAVPCKQLDLDSLLGLGDGKISILEVGGGTGYWARFLARQQGVRQVICTDEMPGHVGWNEYHGDLPTWHEVARSGAAQAIHKYDALWKTHDVGVVFMCYPPPGKSPMALQVLQAMQKSSTLQTLLLVGEFGGDTASAAFEHQLMSEEWEQLGTVELPQFANTCYCLTAWHTRGRGQRPAGRPKTILPCRSCGQDVGAVSDKYYRDRLTRYALLCVNCFGKMSEPDRLELVQKGLKERFGGHVDLENIIQRSSENVSQGKFSKERLWSVCAYPYRLSQPQERETKDSQLENPPKSSKVKRKKEKKDKKDKKSKKKKKKAREDEVVVF